MDWIESIGKALEYIEENLTDDIAAEQVARQACISSFYFQKAFAMLCGFTVGDYIRRRRLSLAGTQVQSTQTSIIEIAQNYGYDSPDSFTKAFTRFHGATPTAVRRGGAALKSFAPLKIKFTLEGGSMMEYKIVHKEAFTVVGVSAKFQYEGAFEAIPKFWNSYLQGENATRICGMYGISIDQDMGSKEFDYMIADNYIPWEEIEDSLTAVTIPKHTWAVFPCRGALPKALQGVNEKIFSEWLPNCREYEIAAGYNIEMYSDASKCKNGISDENYYSEIWIPVKRK